MKQRVAWIDHAKGLAMVMVILGHCGPSIFYNGVYYFHLTMFIMLSGYLLGLGSSSSPLKRIVKKAKGIMWPYLGFGIARLIFDLIMIAFGGRSFSSFVEDLQFIFLWENNANWFLPPLFFGSAAVILVRHWSAKSGKHAWLIHLAACLAAWFVLHASRRFVYYTPAFALKLMSHIVVERNVFLAGRTAAFVLFLEAGFPLCRAVSRLREKAPPRIHPLIAAGALAVFVGCFLLADRNGLNDIHLLLWDRVWYFYVLAILGSAGCLCFVSMLPFRMPALSKIGENTLIINGTHLAFELPIFCRTLIWLLNITMSPTPTVILLTALILLLECPVIVPAFQTVFAPLASYEAFAALLRKGKSAGRPPKASAGDIFSENETDHNVPEEKKKG